MKILMIYSLWWLFWSFIAFIGLGGIIKPSIYTLEIVFVLVFFMWVGYFLKEILPTKKDAVYFSLSSFSDSFLKVLSNANKLILFFCFPFTGYFFLKGIGILSEYGPIGYRRAVYSQPGEPSLLFGSAYIEMLYNSLLSPLIFFSLFSSITLFFYRGNKKYLFFSFLLGFLDSIMMMSRIYLYVFMMLVLVGKFLMKTSNLSVKKILSILSLVFILVVGMSNYRAQDVGSKVNIVDTIISTHSVGFVLFDKELNNPYSGLNEKITYGRAIFGGIDWYANLLIRRFVPEYQVALNSTSRDDFIDLSTTVDEKLYNAYYTLLYTLYSDFRIFGVILFGVVAGFLIRKSYDVFVLHNSPASLFSLMIWTYIFMFSIFSSPLESMKLWGAIIVFLFSIRKAKLNVI